MEMNEEQARAASPECISLSELWQFPAAFFVYIHVMTQTFSKFKASQNCGCEVEDRVYMEQLI
jgi:hypothetical protein